MHRETLNIWSIAVMALCVVLAGLVAPASAGPPQPAKGRGESCVAETDWMRRYHMTVLMHQRDETVHEGMRAAKFSLKGCIDCHQVKGGDGKPVTAADPKHFCRTCHDYAAVRVDCFECHASRPVPAAQGAAKADGAEPAEHAAIARYLKEAGR